MLPIQIERIYLDEKAEKDSVSETVLKALPNIPVETGLDKRSLIRRFSSMSDSIGIGKKHLFITHFYGRRLKPCPGTSNHICCGYYVINAVTNCPMDCSYCVLQGYLNNPFLTLYTNWDDLLGEINDFLSIDRQSLSRLGTGELSDSLALESIFPFSEFLIPFFAERHNGILELKTKSANVDPLLHLNHRGKTVVSWSLNPPKMIEREERRTARLEGRISAARKCQEKGYLLGFHFDPLIYHEGWEKGYQETIRQLFKQIDPRRVVWISLEGFVIPLILKRLHRSVFQKQKCFLGELFPGKRCQVPVSREIRTEMYQKDGGMVEGGGSQSFCLPVYGE